MITKLKGILEEIHAQSMEMDVGGVCYHVSCDARTLSLLPTPQTPVTLYIHYTHRDDGPYLYGFIEPFSRDVFRMLLTVQGVGSRVALALLSVGEASSLLQALSFQDVAYLTQADGVGPKLATRILHECQDKIKKLSANVVPLTVDATSSPSMKTRDFLPDVVSALVELGYRPTEARHTAQHVQRSQGPFDQEQNFLKACLAHISKDMVK